MKAIVTIFGTLFVIFGSQLVLASHVCEIVMDKNGPVNSTISCNGAPTQDLDQGLNRYTLVSGTLKKYLDLEYKIQTCSYESNIVSCIITK